MDPNETLRRLLHFLCDESYGTRGVTDRARLSEAREAFEDLYEWIRVGGFLPSNPQDME